MSLFLKKYKLTNNQPTNIIIIAIIMMMIMIIKSSVKTWWKNDGTGTWTDSDPGLPQYTRRAHSESILNQNTEALFLTSCSWSILHFYQYDKLKAMHESNLCQIYCGATRNRSWLVNNQRWNIKAICKICSLCWRHYGVFILYKPHTLICIHCWL